MRPASAAAAASRSTQRAPGRAGDDGSEGSDWCDDCGVRVRDVDDEEFDRDAEETPARPDCGNAMRFERTTGSDCAC
ncbi:hypothetical protein [Halorubrum trapanicum]|uniref:hypothetical protein n=1 Tax=Halorubrum trapanicum TaxID=29284 RepID=UPI001AE3C303|nr:hypothetical protein [Halorubrum trapanicum]